MNSKRSGHSGHGLGHRVHPYGASDNDLANAFCAPADRDQISAGFTELLRAAEVGGIALDQSRIELMLANWKTQPIAKAMLSKADSSSS